MVALKDHELESNFAYFQSMLPDLIKTKLGEFALIRHKEIVDFYSTSIAAVTEGYVKYPDGLFSVQQVKNRAVDLGFMSYADSSR